MAAYELVFRFVDSGTATVTTHGQPEKIEDFNQKLTATNFQAYNGSSVKSSVINMRNVTVVEIKKLPEGYDL